MPNTPLSFDVLVDTISKTKPSPKNLMKYIVQIILGVILIFVLPHFFNDELQTELIGSGIVIIVTLIVAEWSYAAYENRKRLLLVIQCCILSMRGKYIRFSMSYLYRIKINDKYLLVKNSNWEHYQLVGGKYKRNSYTQNILLDMEARDDLKLQTTGLMKDDLAVFIPAKNAIKFIDWFNTKRNREISHWREFYEELIEGKASVLPQNKFPYVNYNFMGSVITPLKKSPDCGWNCYEILQYDILDLLPTEEQQKELDALFNNGDSEYIKWADEELINNLGHDNRVKKPLYRIGAHTKWALNMKWSKS